VITIKRGDHERANGQTHGVVIDTPCDEVACRSRCALEEAAMRRASRFLLVGLLALFAGLFVAAPMSSADTVEGQHVVAAAVHAQQPTSSSGTQVTTILDVESCSAWWRSYCSGLSISDGGSGRSGRRTVERSAHRWVTGRRMPHRAQTVIGATTARPVAVNPLGAACRPAVVPTR
jgi:hypothetical protein